MKMIRFVVASASLFVMSLSVHAQFANAVLSYNSGTGFPAGYTNTSSALGSPALGSGVTPFAPPFSKSQLVSIGTGGEITLQMSSPILNTPANPYGLDFITFANSFFIESGSGQSATNTGSLFFHQASVQIQVSQDGVAWYTLNPALTPPAGEWFPTYGGGDPLLPVDPALMNSADFTGLTLAQTESLYSGSAGGTGYSLSWAQNANGNSVDLASADYVQIDVESGVLDLDAVSVVPEPRTGAIVLAGLGLLWLGHCRREVLIRVGSRQLLRKTQRAIPAFLAFWFCLAAVSSVRAVTLAENFTNYPSEDGWQVYGDTNLFTWDSTNHVMDVTWDSSQTNSYFYHPLGTTLTKADAFTVSFDIQLNDITWTNYPALAVGLLNLEDATNAGFSRPAATTPNIFEYDYYPDDGLGAPNVASTLADMTVSATNDSDFYFIYDDLPMVPATNYRVTLTHAAGEAGLTATMSAGGTVYTTMPNTFTGPITDFRLDTISINSYQDTGDPLFARGTVGNFAVTYPGAGRNLEYSFANGTAQMRLGTYINWNYTLERSTNLISWNDVSASVSGDGGVSTLTDTNPPAGGAFYRVRASQTGQ